MKKLRLEPEDVQVESFLTSTSATSTRGTIRAKSETGITGPECPTSEAETCNGWPGCPATGQNSEYTCEGTCSDYGCTACNMWC
ncbi:MAG TPA: hypothetical protein VF771_06755 [Longimicrobiaceae bacterium]